MYKLKFEECGSTSSSLASQGSTPTVSSCIKEAAKRIKKNPFSFLLFSTLRGDQENGVSFMSTYQEGLFATNFGLIGNGKSESSTLTGIGVFLT